MAPSQNQHFDYIFTGAGLAALMTVYKMVLSQNFCDKTILLLDENTKKDNDRTWCFWEKDDTIWQEIISKKWDLALFADENFKRDLVLKPYHYNQIKGIDFYNLILETISKQKNITFFNEKVTNINELETHVYVATTNYTFTTEHLLNSIFDKTEVESQQKYPVLQQHFIGWFIKSKQAKFTPEKATFMDFSVAQKGNTRFMYVLPTSKNEALLEYTLFSKDILAPKEYEIEIINYIENLGITDYEIIEKEKGQIPMTAYPFWKKNTRRVINIGTAGGWTKASTGYTFKNSDKKSSELIGFLQTKNNFKNFYKKNKFWFYDLLLLDILNSHNELGSKIFSALFKKGDSNVIFKFLDEETNFLEDLQVILKCPKWLFIRAVLKRIFLRHQLPN